MASTNKLIAATQLACLFMSLVRAQLDPIIIKGSKFFYKTSSEQFFITGVAYQTPGSISASGDTYLDPLADASGCSRDIPLLSELGVNVVRVQVPGRTKPFIVKIDSDTFPSYTIHPEYNHDDCMSALADAGIYVLLDLTAPIADSSIDRDSPEWNNELYTRYTSVVDTMQGYTNVLGFFGGNEVVSSVDNSNAAAFVKAAVRDTKAYIASQGYRAIGVGYSMNDDFDIRQATAAYMNCDTKKDSVDFFGLALYSWCGDSSFTISGFSDRTDEFANYSVPAFLSEYGCNIPLPRTFGEVEALYGPQMTGTFSGGIAYAYFEEDTDYGLVEVEGATVKQKKDYSNLSSQLAKVSPSGTPFAGYSPSNALAACPTEDSSWSAASILPTSPPLAVAALKSAAEAGQGSETSSSGSSPESTSTDTAGKSPSADNGLSTGAQVGIGVGVGGAALLLLAIGGYLIWRKKRRSKWNDAPTTMSEKNVSDRDGAAEIDGGVRRHELEQPRPELASDEGRQELPDRHDKLEIGRSTSAAAKGVESRHELPVNRD